MASTQSETMQASERVSVGRWWESTDDVAEMAVLTVRLGVHPQIVMSHVLDTVMSLDVAEDTLGIVHMMLSWVHGHADTEDVLHELDIYETNNVYTANDMDSAVVRAINALLSWWLAVFCGDEVAHSSMLAPVRECYWLAGEMRGRSEMALAMRRGIPYACLANAWVARLTGEDLVQAEG
jgi:hypothetical protein